MEIRGEYFEELDNGKTILYRHTHEVIQLLKNPPSTNFVLISHNSDGNVTNTPTRINRGSSNDCGLNTVTIPDNLIKWYAQNVDIEHDKIESIPIGLENKHWFRDIKKYEKMLSIMDTEKIYKNSLYVNFNIHTNPSERGPLYNMFDGKPWATVEVGRNPQNFDNYLDNIYNHKFVLSPRGNGIDTHRTWESLYVGSIPIEKRNFNNRFYEDLPICFVDDWADVTEDFLDREYIRITSKTWNLSKLDFDYWKSKINSSI